MTQIRAYKHGQVSDKRTAHPLKRIIAILYVLWKLDGRELSVVYRDYNHISPAAYGTAEMVLRIKISCKPATARVE